MTGRRRTTGVPRRVDPADELPTPRAALVQAVREQVASDRYCPAAESVAEALLSWSLAGPGARPGRLARAS